MAENDNSLSLTHVGTNRRRLCPPGCSRVSCSDLRSNSSPETVLGLVLGSFALRAPDELLAEDGAQLAARELRALRDTNYWVALSRATRNIGTLLFLSNFSDFLGDFDPGELDTRSLVQT